MSELLKKHGGKREGAGRPKKIAKSVNFCAKQEVIDILTLQKNKSEYINNAILEFYKNSSK